MAATKIKVQVRGLTLDEKDNPVLELVPQLEAGILLVTGTPDDDRAFQKLFRKTVEARLTIGADEEAAPDAAEVEKLKAELAAAHARTADLEAQAAKVAEPEKAPPWGIAAQTVHRLAERVLGQVHDIASRHQVAAGTKSATEVAKWAEVVRAIDAGLAEMGALKPKSANGKQTEQVAEQRA